MFAVGCGWNAGHPPVSALSVGAVQGASVEPGLRAALKSELTRALFGRGIRTGGDQIQMTILEGSQAPEGGSPERWTTAVWEAGLHVRFEVPSRLGCSVDVAARRSWATAEDPRALGEARGEAMQQVAAEVVRRGLDGIVGLAACQEGRP